MFSFRNLKKLNFFFMIYFFTVVQNSLTYKYDCNDIYLSGLQTFVYIQKYIVFLIFISGLSTCRFVCYFPNQTQHTMYYLSFHVVSFCISYFIHHLIFFFFSIFVSPFFTSTHRQVLPFSIVSIHAYFTYTYYTF